MQSKSGAPVIDGVIDFKEQGLIHLHQWKVTPVMRMTEGGHLDSADPVFGDPRDAYEVIRRNRRCITQGEREVSYGPFDRAPYVDDGEAVRDQLVSLLRKKVSQTPGTGFVIIVIVDR